MRRRRAGWRLLPHPADLRLQARGPDLATALGAAVQGLAGVITGGPPPAIGHARPVALEAGSPEGLVVALLGECLFLLEAEGFLACDARIEVARPGRCAGHLLGVAFDPRLHGAGTAVKAVTWHRLSVREDDAGALLEVLLDL